MPCPDSADSTPRLTESDRAELLAATAQTPLGADLVDSEGNPGVLVHPPRYHPPLSAADYLRQLDQFRPLLARPKPVHFTGDHWRL